MDEVITWAECYIKGEESNMKKDIEMQKIEWGPRWKGLGIWKNTLSQDLVIGQ